MSAIKLSMLELASTFNDTNSVTYIGMWVNAIGITQEDVDFAVANFTLQQRRSIFIRYIKPATYLVDYPVLLEHVQFIGVDNIKALPEDVYQAHLEQLKKSDKASDEINKRTFPYQSYYAQVFSAFRKATKKSDITFIKRMFGRKIAHHTYPNAKAKLAKLA